MNNKDKFYSFSTPNIYYVECPFESKVANGCRNFAVNIDNDIYYCHKCKKFGNLNSLNRYVIYGIYAKLENGDFGIFPSIKLERID